MSKIEIKNIYKIFGSNPEQVLPMVKDGASKEQVMEETGHTVGLDNVSLSIKEGEIFVCMGLSGSGKSTLIRHINRLIDPTAGEVIVNNVDVCSLNEKEIPYGLCLYEAQWHQGVIGILASQRFILLFSYLNERTVIVSYFVITLTKLF